MPEQFLHRADVGAGLQQVGGERMAQGVYRYGFGNARQDDRLLEMPAQPLFKYMVTAFDTGLRIDRQPGAGNTQNQARPCRCAPRSHGGQNQHP